MSKLLRAGFCRYLKNPLAAIAAAASLAIGLWGGVTAVFTIDDVFLIALFITFAAFVSLLIGREHGDGGFRNKVIKGYTKGQIFFSEWLLHTLICLAMLVIFLVAFCLAGHEVLAPVPSGMLALILFCFVCMSVAIVTLLCVLTLLINNRAIAAILSVLLVVGLLFASYCIDAALTSPQYYQIGHCDETNEIVFWEQVENPRYVKGVWRVLLTHLNYTIPLGQSEPLLELIGIWNYEETQVDLSQLNVAKLLPVYSFCVIMVVGGIGYALFRRRDLK